MKTINQKHFIATIAGLTVEVDSPSPRSYIMCRKFLSNNKPDFQIHVSTEDVKEIVKKTEELGKIANEKYLETLVTYQKFVEKAIYYNTILMHGAVIAVENRAFMFSAPSGTGKTTHIKKWCEELESTVIINGDKPLLQITETEVIACGTPWCGKENMGTNRMVPLKAIVFMERSVDNYIKEISFQQAYKLMLQQTHIPNNTEAAKKTLSLLIQMQGKVRFYMFNFNNYKNDCFQVAYETIAIT